MRAAANASSVLLPHQLPVVYLNRRGVLWSWRWGVVAVFLFRIRAVGPIDQWLWVITGDLPSAYLVTDRATSPVRTLEVYCELMADWTCAVRKGNLRDTFPVEAEPTAENADLLEKRVALLQTQILPAFDDTRTPPPTSTTFPSRAMNAWRRTIWLDIYISSAKTASFRLLLPLDSCTKISDSLLIPLQFGSTLGQSCSTSQRHGDFS